MERRVARLVRKVCLLGDPGVGKTSLIRRYLTGTFDPEQRATIGTQVSWKTVVLSFPERGLDVHLKICVWDITGQRRYLKSHRACIRGAHAAMVLADATRPETLPGTIDWLDDLRAEAGGVPVLVVLNKMDLFERGMVDFELLRDICAGFGCELRLASARTGRFVDSSFDRLLKRMARAAVDGSSGSGPGWRSCA